MFCCYFTDFFWFGKMSIAVLSKILKKCPDTAPGRHGSHWCDTGGKKELPKSVGHPVRSIRLNDKLYCDYKVLLMHFTFGRYGSGEALCDI